jgi:LacI family transcriptional regulator
MKDAAKLPRRRRRTQSAPTIADVARVAGFSPMTVSRVINAEPNVLEATRDKVREAIEGLGYIPNLAARSLAGARKCRIALLYSNPSVGFLSEFMVGSLVQARESDAELIVEHCPEDQSPYDLVQRLGAYRLDAVLLPPPLCDDKALLEALRQAGLLLAQIATSDPAPFARAVSIDDRAAARAMTEHLIGLGHRRLALVTGNPNQTASKSREQGFRDALAAAGVPCNPAWIVQGDFSYRSGLKAAEKLLGTDQRPTAIFASNDDMAAAAVATAHRHGLKVPRDLSICGFDDTAMALSIWPELTTIRQPIADMTRLAVRSLCDDVRGESSGAMTPGRLTGIAFELIRRSSDAAPGGGIKPGEAPL